MITYKAGSDAKTAKMAGELIAKINALMDAGNFQEAEKLIESGTNTPNRPFRIEFATQSAAM